MHLKNYLNRVFDVIYINKLKLEYYIKNIMKKTKVVSY